MSLKFCKLIEIRSCTQRVLTLSALLSTMWGTQAAYAAVGDVDPTFGVGGRVITSLSNIGDYERIYDIAVQSDGKIVVAASTTSDTNGDDFVVARYNTNGTLDTTFSGDGIQTTDFEGNNDGAYAIALQSDGKIVVAGSVYTDADSDDAALARYNTDGTLDTTFGDGGIQTTDFGVSDGLSAIAVQSDGKIVVAGGTYVSDSAEYDFAVARYNADGTLDSSFSNDGVQITGISNSSDYAYDIALQSDGKIVVAGSAYMDATGNDFGLARYNVDGSLDSSFGDGGTLTTDFNNDTDGAYDVALQSDGKIIAAGYAFGDYTTYDDFALARYNSDGSLDTTFSGDGKQTADFNNDTDTVRAVVVQSDGKIVAAGTAYGEVNGDDFAVARFNTEGTLDTSFSGDGKQTTDFNGDEDGAYDVGLQSDGKIVVAGYTYSGDTTGYDFALSRYTVVSNVAPVANPQNITTDEDTPKVITLTASDADGDTLTYSIVSNPSYGILSGSGAYRTYTPNSNYYGSDCFTFQVNDGHGGTNTATVSITVKAVNDAPIANAGVDQNLVQSGATTPATLQGGASSDIDGDSLTYTWRENGNVIATGVNPTVFFATGTHTIILTVSDGSLPKTDTVVISVSAPQSTFGGSVNGTGTFKGQNSSGQISLLAAYNKNGLGGSLNYSDKQQSIVSTQLTSMVVQGNTAHLYGFCKVNGISGYEFALTAYNYYSSFIGQGDKFTLEVSNGSTYSGTMTRGDINVVAPAPVR